MPEYGSAGMGYADGAYKPISELTVPVTDMGFQLSDMCYDAVHVHDGKFFRLDTHMNRFERSIQSRRYDTLGMSRDDIVQTLHGCVARAGLRNSMITFLVTRGSPTTAHKDLRTCQNRYMAWALPYYGVVSEKEAAQGVDIVIAETIRIPTDAVDPTIKNFGRLDFVRALFEAYDRDAKYAVLLDADGNVTEGRGWNLFVLKDGTLLTPDSGVLEGITRQTVLELAGELNVEARSAVIPAGQLRSADEVFLTSTAGGVTPIRSIDGSTIGDGTAGPVTRRLSEKYWALHEDPAYTTPVDYSLGQDNAAE